MYYKIINKNEPAFSPLRKDGDADYDLFSSGSVLIKAGEIGKINTNIAIEFPDGWEGKIEGRSGLAGKGIAVLGGVIDNSYTGPIIIIITNLSRNNILFNSGDRVAQLKIRPISPNFIFEETENDLKKTDRGDKGFGSTGS